MISGGAQGMDIMAAEAVLGMEKDCPEVTLEIAVQFEVHKEARRCTALPMANCLRSLF